MFSLMYPKRVRFWVIKYTILLPSTQLPFHSSSSREADRRTDDPLNANTVLQSSFKLPDSLPSLRQTTRPTQSLDKSRSSYRLSRRFRPTLATDVPPEDENTVPESQNGRSLPPRFRFVLPRRNTPTVCVTSLDEGFFIVFFLGGGVNCIYYSSLYWNLGDWARHELLSSAFLIMSYMLSESIPPCIYLLPFSPSFSIYL